MDSRDSSNSPWRYGLVYQVSESRDVMNAVFEAFASMGVVFIIKSSDYCLKCASGDPSSGNGMTIEFNLRVYKASSTTHMVDIKRNSGSPIMFLDLSDRLKSMLDSKLPACD
jgi:hypothetical protein